MIFNTINYPDFPNDVELLGIRQMDKEYNQEQKQLLEEKHGKSLEEIYNDPNNCRDLVGLFTCSGCGDFLPVTTLKYFKFDLDKARCFKCQGLHF